LRVVLDTNILISAFVFPGGTPETLFRAVLEGRIGLITSPALLAEFGRVLGAKFGWDPERAREAVALVARSAAIVRPTNTLHVVHDDPDDDRVLEAAMAGEAEAIVSGDRHLLRIRSWEGIEILRPAALLALLDAPRPRSPRPAPPTDA